VLGVLHMPAALDYERAQPHLAQVLGGPAPGDAGADDDGVVRVLHTDHVRPILVRGPQPSKRPGTATCRSSRVAPISEVEYPTSVSSFRARKAGSAARSSVSSSATCSAAGHSMRLRPWA